jgi:hypothetical protein
MDHALEDAGTDSPASVDRPYAWHELFLMEHLGMWNDTQCPFPEGEITCRVCTSVFKTACGLVHPPLDTTSQEVRNRVKEEIAKDLLKLSELATRWGLKLEYQLTGENDARRVLQPSLAQKRT